MQGTSSHAVRVARGVVYAYLQNAVSILTTFIYFPVLVRILSQEEVGLTVTLGLILTLAMTLSSFSLPKAITKFVAEDVGKGCWGAIKHLYKKSVQLSIGLGSIASSALLLIYYVFFHYLSSFGLIPQLIALLLANIIILSASGFLNGFLYGLQKFKEIATIGILSSIIRVGSVVTLLFSGYGVAGILIGWIMGDLVGMILYLHSAHGAVRPIIGKDKAVATSELFEYSAPLYGTSILDYLSAYIDRFLLLGLIGLSGLAVYSVAVTASSFLVMISYPISYVLFPFFSEIYGKNNNESLQIASLKATRYTSLIFVPAAVGLATISYPAIILFAGTTYVEATLPLTILCLTMAFTQVGVAITPTLLSQGKTKVLLNEKVLGILVNTIIVFILAPFIGINGAALGRMGLLVVGLGYPLYVLVKSHSFYVDKEAFTKAWIGSLMMAIVVLTTQSFLFFDSKFMPLYVLFGFIAYIATIRRLKLIGYEDSRFLKSLLPKRFVEAWGLFTRIFGIKSPEEA